MASKLSEHFCLEEFERSVTAKRLGICNAAPQGVITNLQYLCQHILEPARHDYGRPIVILSGFRCNVLNKAVGGVSNSQHRYGEAVDLPYSPELLAILQTLPYDQIIVEHNSKSKWLHVSYKPFGPNRHQFIRELRKLGIKEIRNLGIKEFRKSNIVAKVSTNSLNIKPHSRKWMGRLLSLLLEPVLSMSKGYRSSSAMRYSITFPAIIFQRVLVCGIP